MSKNERQPLLTDIEKVRAAAPATADGQRLLRLSVFTNANIPWYMFLVNTGKSILYVLTVWASFTYIEQYWENFIVPCSRYDGSPIRHTMCHVTGCCFWTFPLLTAMIVIITFWRHLYNSRLYYECLLHRVMISYNNEAIAKCPLTWVYVLYGILAVSVSLFAKSHSQFAWARPIPKDVATVLEVWIWNDMLIYCAPLLSFFMVFLSVWQVEWHLLPLTKFFETDPDLAQEVLSQTVVVPDVHLRVAFEAVEDALDSSSSLAGELLTSSEYFALVAAAARAEMKLAEQLAKDQTEAPESPWESLQARLDPCYTHLGIVRIKEYGHDYPVTRPEVLSWSYRLSRKWWVHRLLHSRHFNDDRAASFRFWGWVHIALAVFAILCLCDIYSGQIVDWFKTQRKLNAVASPA